ncbi:MAG: hypothetical protein R2912_00735 [Eubacteriales bacterium]
MFDIYTDIDSKIKHYQRINYFWTVFMIIRVRGSDSEPGARNHESVDT